MKYILLILFSFGLTAHAGTEVRNGGGGINNNGRYMTFKTAQVPVQNKELTVAEVPSLDLLILSLQKTYLQPATKADITSRALPSVNRHYYKADENRLDKATYEAILAEYQANMGITEKNFALFAVTDARTRTTVLFPEFFQLTRTEQAAVLLHEALWTYPSMKSYSQVVQTEIALQDVLETTQPTSEQIWNFYNSLLTALGDQQQLLGIAYTLFPPNLPVKDIFGGDGYLCMINKMNSADPNTSWGDCAPYIENNLALLLVTAPMNHFYEAFYSYLIQSRSVLTMVHWTEVEEGASTPLQITANGFPLYMSGTLESYDNIPVIPVRNAAGTRAAGFILKF